MSNKYQEALDELIEELPYTSGIIKERIKTLQELVDKETANNVKIKEFDNGEYGAYCPRCNSGLPFHWKIKVCPSCSQKLDWSEENDN